MVVEILLNGRPKRVARGPLSFEEISGLAFEGVSFAERVPTITWYRRGERLGGTLSPGGTLEAQEGLVINAIFTDNA